MCKCNPLKAEANDLLDTWNGLPPEEQTLAAWVSNFAEPLSIKVWQEVDGLVGTPPCPPDE